MVTPRSIAMGFVGRMDLAHPSAADKLAIKTSGFSFLVYLCVVCGLYEFGNDFHDSVSAADEGNIIFQ